VASQQAGPEWQLVELYSTFLRIQGELLIEPPLRLTDEVNRMSDHLELRNTTTEPLLSTYPVVSPVEALTTIEKASIVMVLPEARESDRGQMMWKEKVRYQVVINTTAFSMACDVHLEPRVSLLTHLQRYEREFLPVTRMSAVAVASLIGLAPGAEPQTLQRDFALVNPRNIVSFSVRPNEDETGGNPGT
jgi:hypothetical protein